MYRLCDRVLSWHQREVVACLYANSERGALRSKNDFKNLTTSGLGEKIDFPVLILT